MSLAALIKGRRGKSGFGFASTATEVAADQDLNGKTIVITGVNSGLGLHSAQVLSGRGAHIVGLARTVEKAAEACSTFSGASTPLACDLSDPSSVRACVATVLEKMDSIDVILCNAGIMALPKLALHCGYEAQFFTNHIGHFILTTGLLPRLASNGRVVMLSSSAHKMTYKEGIQWDNLDGAAGYDGWKAYGQSKLANLLFARELATRFEGTDKVAVALHPGVIRTNLGRHMGSFANGLFAAFGTLFFKTIPQGAATQVYAACHPDGISLNGKYLFDCNVQDSTPHGQDMALAKRLWEKSEEIVATLPPLQSQGLPAE